MWVEEVALVEAGDSLYGLAHGQVWRTGAEPVDECYLVERVLPLTPSGRVFVVSREGKRLPRPMHYRVLRREDGDFGYDGSRAEQKHLEERERQKQRVRVMQTQRRHGAGED